MKAIKYLGFILIGSFILSSCTFEEGPFSFRSKTHRLANTWRFDEVFENGVVVTFLYSNRSIKFTDNRQVIIKILSPQGFETVLQGTWDYGDHWDRLIIDVTDTETSEEILQEWAIKRLANDEFIAEEYTAGKKFRYELKPL